MEFNGQYLTYVEYKALGGTLDLAPFNVLEFEARRQIDIGTYNRIKELDPEDIPQEAKICDFNLINLIERYAKSTAESSGNGNIANESIDGYSISYLTADKVSEITKSKSVEISAVIRDYFERVIINGEHAIYCGVK